MNGISEDEAAKGATQITVASAACKRPYIVAEGSWKREPCGERCQDGCEEVTSYLRLGPYATEYMSKAGGAS